MHNYLTKKLNRAQQGTEILLQEYWGKEAFREETGAM